MKPISIPALSWIIVCDGGKALIFENLGNARALNLKVLDVDVEFHPPTRALGTERPGRTVDSADGSRSAVEGTDWHEAAEAEFLGRLANKIDELVHRRKPRHLVIVAPPKALGILRERFTAGVRAVLTSEVAKDLVKLPTSEIERHLSSMTLR